MQTLIQRYLRLQQRIQRAAEECNRIPDSVQLLAVSKAWPPEQIVSLYDAGQRDFGENYVQEAIVKIQALSTLPIHWHFIGQLQTNKTRAIAESFDWVHSVDRYKTAKRLNDQRPENFKPLNICLQLKLHDQATQAGIAPAALSELAHAVAELPRLKLRGLMITSPQYSDSRTDFRQLRRLFDELNANGLNPDHLSMGMSNDFEDAIAEGATWVRIGTALFGPRPQTRMQS